MSFLRNFMEWNKGVEVSENYFFWTGISALAACVNGQIWIHQGKFVHFPNMYIILLGPAGNGKNVAIDRAEDVVREIGDITLSGQAETPEGLVRFMRDKCVRSQIIDGKEIPFTPLSLYVPELSNFFGKDPAGMIDLLTGIWDRGGRQFFRRTKGAGEDMLPRPNMNMLGGTTPAWITQYLKADIVGGGFTRRVVFVNEPRRDANHRVAWPMDSREGMTARDNCIAYGKVLRGLSGEVKYTHEAKLEYIRWYDMRAGPKTEEEEGYHASKPGIMLKVASLLAVSREPKLEISKEDVELALALLETSERNRQKVFDSIGRNELNVIAQRVLSYLNNVAEATIEYNGKPHLGHFCNEKVLQGLLYRDAPGRELEDIFAHLIATEKVKRVTTISTPPRTFLILCEGFRPLEGQHHAKDN